MIAEVEAEQASAIDAEKGHAARLIRLRGIGLVSASASKSRLPRACGMWVQAPIRADRI
jgi:hypothetical protein